jgi:betaine lipid synthase
MLDLLLSSYTGIRDFMDVIDSTISMLAKDGLVGVVDFFTSSRYDLPNRQHSYVRRWLWRAAFDYTGYDVGPERRQYLEHNLEAGNAIYPEFHV